MSTYVERIGPHVTEDLAGEIVLAAAKASPHRSHSTPADQVVATSHYMTLGVTPTRLLVWKNSSIHEHPRRLVAEIPLVSIARLLDGHGGKLGVRLRDNRLLEVEFRGDRAEGHAVVHALRDLLRH